METPLYAINQPAGFTNRIQHVAVVGAGGQLGKYIVNEILDTKRHVVTALVREGSTDKVANTVKTVVVDYNDEQTLVDALQDQQFLIITMSVMAPAETHSKLFRAAAAVGVRYVMPSYWSSDMENKRLMAESPWNPDADIHCAEIERLGVSSWITPVCGLWFQYSLVMGPTWFGFDFEKKKLTFYDDGNTKINVTTFDQCGRAVAALLRLKELPEDAEDQSPTISSWKNKPLYVASFLISQKDMFESWKRVSGDTDQDWTIESETSQGRYQRGLDMMGNPGDPASFRAGGSLASFVRIFFPNGGGDYESAHGLANGPLGLPKEELDECTKGARKMLDDGYPSWVTKRLTG